MFGFKLKSEYKALEAEYKKLREFKNELIKINNELADKVEEYMRTYPFQLGQVVYDVQLRSSKGRFTKTKASREHSIINEVVVDKKNYFNLVDRYNNFDVFTTLKNAEEHLDSVCVD